MKSFISYTLLIIFSCTMLLQASDEEDFALLFDAVINKELPAKKLVLEKPIPLLSKNSSSFLKKPFEERDKGSLVQGMLAAESKRSKIIKLESCAEENQSAISLHSPSIKSIAIGSAVAIGVALVVNACMRKK